MKFNYKLQRLCGAYYGCPTGEGGSNVIYDSTGNSLISAVTNRIQVLNLQSHTVRALPIEARSNIRFLALSKDDSLLIAVDVLNYALLISFHRGIVLHRFKFSQRVRHMAFSPASSSYLAVTHGKHVQVWCTPRMQKELTPLVLHRTYTGLGDDVTCLAWSPDESFLAAGSRDCSIRIWTLHSTLNYEPVTLAGHKKPIVGLYLLASGDRVHTCYSVSEDGALVTWECEYNDDESIQVEDMDTTDDYDAVGFFTGGNASAPVESTVTSSYTHAEHLVKGTWKVKNRHYFNQDNAIVSTVSYSERGQIMAVGFSSGLFGLYEMPSAANLHTLSIGSNQLIRASALNHSGEWLALACPKSQQLLVWEWRSETYVLKQRGHAYGMRCMAYSPDGVILCTGGEDGKIKLWNATSGFCYVTLEQNHTAPVTAVAFAKASVVLSASLDGTVRAHDLHRYRTFRTLTTPTPVQFLSLAIDPSGEIVTAGSTDPFHIYAWNLQTGKLLDVFTGHAGPVCSMAFQPSGGVLVSASWDGTVKLWDLYKKNVATENLQHTADVVCVASRPDGKEICSGTTGGMLCIWDVETGRLKYEIDGRRDISGGRKMNDRMTADNNAAGRYFTSVCYSADGSFILAGGNSKYVCIYELSQQILLKKFQVTFNRSLDGVLDEVRSVLYFCRWYAVTIGKRIVMMMNFP
ncbi:periodic tryptophan protein 2 [Fistulifera solaris]|uniref:Periodic tryptophan protein 2 n=1 Tax=Fistulifera solaris TaxID=1519565 RepID=A0A1Z5K8S7_FISSO|nr:periodic tryptophan protein 2 [Fistulifera solaris]|eukprot:GAX22659.1 periodic tryptophan protein 2 [Fistulifera solaris]